MVNIPEIDDKDLVKNTDPIKEVEIELTEIEDGIIIIPDEDALDKNMKFIEGTIRKSFEYKNYINYLKNGLNMNKCKFLPGLDASNIHISLEMHHAPFTLYDIVQIIGKKHIEEDGGVDVFTIVNEVLEEHYKNHVGLVPLSATLHELVHNRKITISPDKVYGNFSEFYKKYEPYLTDDQSAKFAEFLGTTPESTEHEIDCLSKEIKHYKVSLPKAPNDLIFQ